jgi:hypothetical protein
MDPSNINLPDRSPIDYATKLVLRVCRLAGSASFVDDAREALAAEGVHAAVRNRDTAVLFDWLVSILSYQGISDQVAFDYMELHGRATWQVIASDLRRRPSCPKLESYWHFHDCRYNKTQYTCAEPNHLPNCPLPNHWLRNGRLNQTAYALHLFIRDIAGGDLVGWIDRRLNTAARQPGPGRLASMRTAVLAPLKEVYGVSDKILMMALSVLFLGAPGRRRRWLEVGGSMIAVDTLVHNFRRDAERPTRAIRLRNICPTHWRRYVATRPDAIQEVQEIGFQVCRIVVRRHTVDARSTILAGQPAGFFHPHRTGILHRLSPAA